MLMSYGNACITNLDMENGYIIKDSFIELNTLNNIGNNCKVNDWGDIQDMYINNIGNASISYLPYGYNNDFNYLIKKNLSPVIIWDLRELVNNKYLTGENKDNSQYYVHLNNKMSKLIAKNNHKIFIKINIKLTPVKDCKNYDYNVPRESTYDLNSPMTNLNESIQCKPQFSVNLITDEKEYREINNKEFKHYQSLLND